MTRPDDLAAQVAALAERVEMESGLRASADRDLSSLAANQRAQSHLIQAIAITQGEHTQAFEQLRVTLAEHRTLLDQIVSMLNQLLEGPA